MNSRPTGSGRSPSSSARSSRPPRPGSISRRRRSMGDGTPLGRVRGIGSANHGTGHWLQQRFTALGNLLLVTWLVVSLIRLPLNDPGAVLRSASNPPVPLALLLLVARVFLHLPLALRPDERRVGTEVVHPCRSRCYPGNL